MMQSLAQGGGIPGMPGTGGGKRAKAKQAPQEGQGQARVRQPGEARRAGARPPPQKAAGPGRRTRSASPARSRRSSTRADFDLPPEVAKFLK